MELADLFIKYRDKFVEETLAQKTTWGRNELTREFDRWMIQLTGELSQELTQELVFIRSKMDEIFRTVKG